MNKKNANVLPKKVGMKKKKKQRSAAEFLVNPDFGFVIACLWLQYDPPPSVLGLAGRRGIISDFLRFGYP